MPWPQTDEQLTIMHSYDFQIKAVESKGWLSVRVRIYEGDRPYEQYSAGVYCKTPTYINLNFFGVNIICMLNHSAIAAF